MSWILIISLIILGLLLVLLEIFILPGMIAGIVGGILVLFGIIKSYVEFGPLVGTITLVAVLAVFIGLMVLFFRTGTWKKIALHDIIDGKVNVIEENKIKTGDTGIAISRLAPMGKAFINNEYYEVSSNIEFIDAKTKIVVVKVEDNKIFVREL